MTRLDELGLSLIFVEHNRGKLYYHEKQWYQWDGKRWICDSATEERVRGEATKLQAWLELMILTTNASIQEIARKVKIDPGDSDKVEKLEAYKKSLLAAQTRCGSVSTLDAIIKLARHNLLLPEGASFDGPETDLLLNVQNGVLDFRGLASSGQVSLIPHDDAQAFLITRIANVSYDPDAACPVWEEFLLKAQEGRDEVVTFLSKLTGVWLTGLSNKFFTLLWGPSDSGKTTYFNIPAFILGKQNRPEDMAVTLNRDVFDKGAHTTSQADLFGKRLVLFPELDREFQMPVGMVKQWTGGDGVSARKMRENNTQARQTWHLVLTCNRKPKLELAGQDGALRNRLVFVPFPRACPKEEQDPGLQAKLESEASGILNWAIAGLAIFMKDGQALNPPEYIQNAKLAYETEMADSAWHHWKDDILEYIGKFPQPFGDDGALANNPQLWLSVPNLFNILGETRPDDRDKAKLTELMHSLGYVTKSKPNTFTKKNERVYFPEVKTLNTTVEALTQETLEMILDATRIGIDRVKHPRIQDARLYALRRIASALPEHRMLDILKGVKDVHAAYLKAGEVIDVEGEYATELPGSVSNES